MKRWLYHYDIVHGSPQRLELVLRHRVRDLFASISADGTAESTPQGELLIRLPAHVLGGAVTLRRRRKLARTVGEACTRPAIEGHAVGNGGACGGGDA